MSAETVACCPWADTVALNRYPKPPSPPGGAGVGTSDTLLMVAPCAWRAKASSSRRHMQTGREGQLPRPPWRHSSRDRSEPGRHCLVPPIEDDLDRHPDAHVVDVDLDQVRHQAGPFLELDVGDDVGRRAAPV